MWLLTGFNFSRWSHPIVLSVTDPAAIYSEIKKCGILISTYSLHCQLSHTYSKQTQYCGGVCFNLFLVFQSTRKHVPQLVFAGLEVVYQLRCWICSVVHLGFILIGWPIGLCNVQHSPMVISYPANVCLVWDWSMSLKQYFSSSNDHIFDASIKMCWV